MTSTGIEPELPACSPLSQPTTLPRVPFVNIQFYGPVLFQMAENGREPNVADKLICASVYNCLHNICMGVKLGLSHDGKSINRVCENRELRISGTKMQKAAGCWRKLHNEGFISSQDCWVCGPCPTSGILSGAGRA
jgi:hypothetical protein